MATPLFPLGVILRWALENPNCIPNLNSLASAVAKILKGNPKILGSFPSPGPGPLFSAWEIMMGLGEPERLAKFEVAGFIYYGNVFFLNL